MIKNVCFLGDSITAPNGDNFYRVRGICGIFSQDNCAQNPLPSPPKIALNLTITQNTTSYDFA